ncbi:asparagine synthase (glutamine-hydrolyzing) [Thalassotalea nanhaiensis]|uniref:asparagine synthase (glutamine-hydrolyzing) n=1 Tax=Thalassotalea nanhaiensis TaxID=3065648 RepID=A0ABY9TIN1_9GAMM|nr:asparagine synthase (glutamine-hydrolyzing) [Colwelliaceae bacterium SQ345]
MCAIYGMSCVEELNKNTLISILNTMHYRGPDDKGLWCHEGGNLMFAHLRLSVIDTTAAGRQPFEDKDHNCVITYNGEVYNYLEIRSELETKGYKFHTKTDTEVIVKAYIEYGHGCLEHFNGMFSFVIWDGRSEELFLARDRLGIKPLYYSLIENQFIFSSEVKAILAGLKTKPKVNKNLIDDYMSFGYIPGENTLHKGIMRLLPAHYAVFKDEKLSITQYWDLSFENTTDKGFEYYLSQSKSLLENSINLRLRSDVPLGIFLSGGIDSSAVVGLLADKVKEPLKTFSISYDFGSEYDESIYAKQVAEKFKTDHHEIKITPQQFKKFIPEYIRLMDEPVTEAAAISLFFVSKLAKEQVTVALSGEGSDEIFAGYDLYQYMYIIEGFHKTLGTTVTNWISKLSKRHLGENHKLSKYLYLASLPFEQRYKGVSTYSNSYKELLYQDKFKAEITEKNLSRKKYQTGILDKTKGQNLLNRMLYFDTKTWLVDDLLIKADRMSMAASVELRVPFLDYRLVEFAATIPSKYKIKQRQGKYILKKMMEGILPKNIIYRKKKGFPTPLKLMFQHELKGYVEEVLLSDNAKVHQYFKVGKIKELIDEHNGNKSDHHRTLWQLIVLEEWLKQNTD